jgi:hypothetical protein
MSSSLRLWNGMGWLLLMNDFIGWVRLSGVHERSGGLSCRKTSSLLNQTSVSISRTLTSRRQRHPEEHTHMRGDQRRPVVALECEATASHAQMHGPLCLSWYRFSNASFAGRKTVIRIPLLSRPRIKGHLGDGLILQH